MALRSDVLLRLEALAALCLTVAGYQAMSPHHWLLFAALFLAPDLSLIGYAGGNPARSAAIYNLAHNLVLPFALGAAGSLSGHGRLTTIAFIWAAHIFFDRMLGYGLKFPQAFKPTHIQSAAVFRG